MQKAYSLEASGPSPAAGLRDIQTTLSAVDRKIRRKRLEVSELRRTREQIKATLLTLREKAQTE